MSQHLSRSYPGIIFFLAANLISHIAYPANEDGAGDLGADYAFLSLMTLAPDFTAADYTIQNEDSLDVDISIGRFPYHIDLIDGGVHELQLEIGVAYQRTEEVIPTFPLPSENIDSRWDTYGAGIGVLYEYILSGNLRFTPSLRVGITRMENSAIYNGSQTNASRSLFDGTLFNWETNASVSNIGLGLDYEWKLIDRVSHIDANVYHVFIDSFNESNRAVKFSENANMLALKADMIFPTNAYTGNIRLDIVSLFGMNYFFGENRRTLGYVKSYQAGLGTELPVRWKQHTYGHVRFSGQTLWASDMEGWLLSIGFNPE